MVRLEQVTKRNLNAVLALKANDSQTGFVSTTAESLAQAYVYAETAFPFAVSNDQDVVGFIMMGYYEEKKYYPKTIEGIFEITSLLGTLTTKDGEPYLHLHISCGGMDAAVVGGHLNKAIVSATGEIVIRVVNGTINRKFSNEIGLFLFDF